MARTTIAAIASPPGPGARGIVRVSGPAARDVVRALWRGAAIEFRARALLDGRVDDGRGTQPALCLWMPGPRSYTGEDVAELHVPGSPPLVAALLARVLRSGAELARPGEFTRRAFENGRIDLTRAEGVADLIAAGSADEARAAGALLFGGLDERVRGLRDALDDLRALCEASLDFDESDTGHVPADELARDARAIRAQVEAALGAERARARSGGSPRVVLCGAPNAGKSALYNALVRAHGLTALDAPAIVSPAAGTTRDVLEAALEIGGRPARVYDTPGFDAVAAGIERAAQDAARGRLAHADLALWVVDATSDTQLALDRARIDPATPVLLAWNQVDRADARSAPSAASLRVERVVATSALRGDGLEELGGALAAALEPIAASSHADAAARHLGGLGVAAEELDAAVIALDGGLPLDLAAEHLRRATAGLDELRGTTTAEDLLDRIFARFCLGK